MKKYNALVTGVGAVVGYGIISALRKSCHNVNIISMDIYDDVVGKEWSDKFYKAVRADDDKYISFLNNIIEKENIDIVFFGTEQEMLKCIYNYQELGHNFNKLVLNSKEMILLTQDKWSTYMFLKNNNFPAIPTIIEGSYQEAISFLGEKILVKPRNSYASKGIVIIDDETDYMYWKQKLGAQFMVQKIMGTSDREYTVAVFGYGDGTSTNPICFKRILSGEGATAKAEVVNLPELNKAVENYTKNLKPIGPTNYQFRYDNGQYYLLEINPRISSSTSIRSLLGYNEPELCINYFIEGKKQYTINYENGKIIRYIADIRSK